MNKEYTTDMQGLLKENEDLRAEVERLREERDKDRRIARSLYEDLLYVASGQVDTHEMDKEDGRRYVADHLKEAHWLEDE